MLCCFGTHCRPVKVEKKLQQRSFPLAIKVIYFSYLYSQKGQTPLHYAAQNDHSQVVTLFLNHKPGVMMQQNAVGNS